MWVSEVNSGIGRNILAAELAAEPEEFVKEAKLDENIKARLAMAEIFQAGYLELYGVVYRLTCRGLPAKYL